MKKKMLFILPLATLCVVGAGVGSSILQVKAEDESSIIEEEQPVEEDIKEGLIDWEKVKADLEEAEAKIHKANEYEFLGITLGSVIGAGVSLLISFVFKKVGNKNIEDACKLANSTNAKMSEIQATAKNQLNQIEELALELKKHKELNEDIIKANNELIKFVGVLKEKSEIADKDLNELKAILLKMAYSNKDLVKNGVANELSEKFNKE